jgi:hypothetical protein
LKACSARSVATTTVTIAARVLPAAIRGVAAVTVRASHDQLRSLCELLVDELVAKEFDEHWVPTGRGVQIEALIDKRNPFSQS